MLTDDRPDWLRAAAEMPGHLDCWDCNCHGFEGGVDWCQDPETWDPAMAARAADILSGAYARRVLAGHRARVAAEALDA